MKQLNNEVWCDYYYLTREGKIYNSNTQRYYEFDANYCYKLKTIDGKYKKISIRNLYKEVYNEWFVIDRTDKIENEVWKFIPGNSKYQASTEGRIKSFCHIEARILKPSYVKGYPRVCITEEDGSHSYKLVSRLIAMTFLDAPPSIDYQLHHLDQDKSNSKLNNLVWLSPAEHRAIHKKLREEAEKDKN